MTFKHLCATTAFGLAMTVSSAAMAAGTLANTSVVNTIDLSYDVNGTSSSQTGAASTTFLVDRKVNLSNTNQNSGNDLNVAPGGQDEVLTFRLENLGNDTSAYDIDLAQSGSLALSYDGGESGADGTYYIKIGDSVTPQPVDATVTTAGTVSIGDVPADGVKYIFIHAFIPPSADNGDQAVFDITVTALDASSSVVTTETRGQGAAALDTVFADTVNQGTRTDSASYTVSAPDLLSTKTSTVLSENLDGFYSCEFDVPDPGAEAYTPGACIEYTITVTNQAGAGAAADNLVVTDTLPTDLTYVTHDVGTFDNVVPGAGNISATISTLPVGNSASFTVRATVN